MGYSGARGGLDTILAAEALTRRARDGGPAPWASTEQITARFRLAVDRVMGEAGLYHEATAADAFRQAEGDTLEAAHLVRAHRSMLPRLATSEPVDPDEMSVLRRIVPAHRTPDGPQLLGRTTDYTGRLLQRQAGPPPAAPVPSPQVEPTGATRQAGTNGTPPPRTDDTVLPGTDGTLPPRTDGTVLPGTDGALPPRTAGTVPPGTDGTLPPGTDGTRPPGTDGTLPPGTDGTLPPGTDGTRPPGTDPTRPPGTDRYRPPGTDRVKLARTEEQRRPRRFSALLRELDLLVDHGPAPTAEPFDVTRRAARPPAPRSAVLSSMARAETGALVGLWYRSVLGPDGHLHEVTLGEVRHGWLPLRVRHPHTGNPVTVGRFRATETEAIEDLDGPAEDRTRFDVGYGLCFGHNERKAIAMANLDVACRRYGRNGPLEQLLLLAVDGLDSGGFLEHLKLPHYVTFRSMTERKQAMRAAASAGPASR